KSNDNNNKKNNNGSYISNNKKQTENQAKLMKDLNNNKLINESINDNNKNSNTNNNNYQLGHFITDISQQNKIEKRFENAYLLLKRQIFLKELQKKPFNPVNCKALINKLFPMDESDISETINLKYYPSPRLDYISVIYSMEEYLQKQKLSNKKVGRKKKSQKSKEEKEKEKDNVNEIIKNETPISKFENRSSWKQTKLALEFYLESIRKCL
ncbi:hypothetical protein BCR32DRAFT_329708, partial [Anaeromyces robustus]